MPAGMLSAKLPASSPPTEALPDPKGIDLTVAAIRPTAVNSQRDARSTQQRYQSTELGRTFNETDAKTTESAKAKAATLDTDALLKRNAELMAKLKVTKTRADTTKLEVTLAAVVERWRPP